MKINFKKGMTYALNNDDDYIYKIKSRYNLMSREKSWS